MKIKIINSYILLTLMLLTLVFSCRTEDDLSIDPPAEATIAPNSTIANLMGRVAANDGSDDNIIDLSSSLEIQLPVTVTVNDIELEIVDEQGYEDIETIIDEDDEDEDSVVITYPITVILPDYSEVVLNSDSELNALIAAQGSNNGDDEDIECIDFQYPIIISYFDEITELASTITINNDNQMFDFIENLDDYAAVTIDFPITVIFPDDTTQIINTVQELEDVIEAADGTCDEDDDNDFDDDDCDSCNTSDLDMLFADCMEWTVDDLERNDNDLEDNYIGYTFTFASDGTISVVEGTNTFNGTWIATGSGNDIVFIINIIGLNDFNGTWNLDELEQEPGEAEFELSIGEDSLSFVSDCEDEIEYCDNPQATTLPYKVVDVAGEFCLEISESVLYFNSWGIDVMEVNGVDVTNQWVHTSLPNFPEAVNGKYYVSYTVSNTTESGVDIGTTLPNHISCVNPTEIIIPFSFDGAGEFCWVTSEDIVSIISTNATIVEVNGIDITNELLDTTSINFPDKIDGKYFIRYESAVASGHFEAGLELIETPSDLELAFEECQTWRVNQISINLLDLLGLYIGHEFTFNNDGTIEVTSLLANFNGTWEITGTQDTEQFLIIDIPGLSDFSDTWTVDSVDLGSEPMTIVLSSGNNSLIFESDCI